MLKMCATIRCTYMSTHERMWDRWNVIQSVTRNWASLMLTFIFALFLVRSLPCMSSWRLSFQVWMLRLRPIEFASVYAQCNRICRHSQRLHLKRHSNLPKSLWMDGEGFRICLVSQLVHAGRCKQRWVVASVWYRTLTSYRLLHCRCAPRRLYTSARCVCVFLVLEVSI